VLGNTPFVSLASAALIGNLANATSGFTVIFLWWFALSCFGSRFRLQGGVVISGMAWAGIAAADRGLFGEPPGRHLHVKPSRTDQEDSFSLASLSRSDYPA
jgi:hypothetical protein